MTVPEPSPAPSALRAALRVAWHVCFPLLVATLLGVVGLLIGAVWTVDKALSTETAMPIHSGAVAVIVAAIVAMPILLGGLCGVNLGLAVSLIPGGIRILLRRSRHWHSALWIELLAGAGFLAGWGLALTVGRRLIADLGFSGRDWPLAAALGLVSGPYFVLQGAALGAEVWAALAFVKRLRAVEEGVPAASLRGWLWALTLLPWLLLPLFSMLPVYALQVPLFWLAGSALAVRNLRHRTMRLEAVLALAACVASLACLGGVMFGALSGDPP